LILAEDTGIFKQERYQLMLVHGLLMEAGTVFKKKKGKTHALEA